MQVGNKVRVVDASAVDSSGWMPFKHGELLVVEEIRGYSVRLEGVPDWWCMKRFEVVE